MRRMLSAVAALASAVQVASGQVLYQTPFHDAADWALDPPNPQFTVWRVDSKPESTPGGAFHSPPASLNYDNNVDYAGAGLSFSNGSNAVSPWIDLSVATGVPTLVFWCNNRLQEQLCDNHESVTVRIQDASGVLKLWRCLTCASCYQNMGPISPCTFGAWHEHAIPLDAAWGPVRVVFRFRGDAVGNDTEGMFLDDLSVVDVQPTTAYCTPKVNSQGCVARMSSTGVPDLTPSGAFAIRADGVLNQKSGLLFYGLNGRHAGPYVGGTLCVKAPLRRTQVGSSGGNVGPDDCSGVLTLDFNAYLAGGADPALGAGAVVDSQWWYRDPVDPHRAGLSDGLEFTVLP
jgi:hypothetical protein